MSDLLQITCPKCNARLNIQRPSAAKAKVTCTCGQSITFNVAPSTTPVVSQAAAPTPPQPQMGQPAAPNNAVSPARNMATTPTAPAQGLGGAPAQGFGGAPAQGFGSPNPTAPDPFAQPPGGFPAASNGQSWPASPNPGAGSNQFGSNQFGPAGRGAPGRSRKQRSIGKPIGIVLGGVVGVAVLGVGGWFAASMLGLFGSPKSLIRQANANDQKAYDLMMTIEGDTVSEEKVEKLVSISQRSGALFRKAIMMSPYSEETAKALEELNADADGIPQGPVTEEQSRALRDRVKDLPTDKRMELAFAFGSTLGISKIMREYLRFGKMELPTSDIKGEQLDLEYIRLLRQQNKTIAGAQVELDYETMKEEFKTPEKRSEFIDNIYSPILDDLAEIEEEINALAEQRESLSEDEVGEQGKYKDIMRYASMVGMGVNNFYVNTQGTETRTQKQFKTLFAAEQRYTRADFQRSQRINQEKFAAAQKQIEEDRKARQEKQIADREKAERERQEKLAQQRESQQAANARANELAMGSSGGQPTDPASAAPTATGRPFDPTGLRDQMNNRMRGFPGSGRPGSNLPGSNRPGTGGPGFGGPGFGGPGFGGPGFGGPSFSGRPGATGGPRGARSFGPPSDEAFAGGVTIQIQNTQGIEIQALMKSFREDLKIMTTRMNSSGGKATIRLGYKGSLQEIIDILPDREITTNESSRTITVK